VLALWPIYGILWFRAEHWNHCARWSAALGLLGFYGYYVAYRLFAHPFSLTKNILVLVFYFIGLLASVRLDEIDARRDVEILILLYP
jgi:hypothetical protein